MIPLFLPSYFLFLYSSHFSWNLKRKGNKFNSVHSIFFSLRWRIIIFQHSRDETSNELKSSQRANKKVFFFVCFVICIQMYFTTSQMICLKATKTMHRTRRGRFIAKRNGFSNKLNMNFKIFLFLFLNFSLCASVYVCVCVCNGTNGARLLKTNDSLTKKLICLIIYFWFYSANHLNIAFYIAWIGLDFMFKIIAWLANVIHKYAYISNEIRKKQNTQ